MTESLVTVRNLELLFFSGALGFLLFEAFGKKDCATCPACGGPSVPPVVTPEQGGAGSQDLPPGTVIDTTGIDTTEAFAPQNSDFAAGPATVTSSPGPSSSSTPPRSSGRSFTSTPSAYSSSPSSASSPGTSLSLGKPVTPSGPAASKTSTNVTQAPPPQRAPSSSPHGQTFTPRGRR